MKRGGLEGVFVLDCSMPRDGRSDSVSPKSHNRFTKRQGADSRFASPHKNLCFPGCWCASGICGVTTKLRGQREEEEEEEEVERQSVVNKSWHIPEGRPFLAEK